MKNSFVSAKEFTNERNNFSKTDTNSRQIMNEHLNMADFPIVLDS